MLACAEPQTGRAWVLPGASDVPVGAKPPSNQPQETFLAFSRSPMFCPVSAARAPSVVWLPSEQSS